jgi:hypothetical protein
MPIPVLANHASEQLIEYLMLTGVGVEKEALERGLAPPTTAAV